MTQPNPAQSGQPQIDSASGAAAASKASTGDQTSDVGLTFERFYATAGVDPFDAVEWEMRDAVIHNENGEAVFEQRGVEIPAFWSQSATNVVVSKYFRGQIGTDERESSVRQLIVRIVETMAGWGRDDGYFASEEDAGIFADELKHILLHQLACFNSPVWFNVGIEEHPQCSACFINSVEDQMGSILDLAKTEGMLFKYGSGAGCNLSSLRSSKELLAGGGTASGPVSFMRGFDSFAGAIKSGGKTRRAAKMVILNVDHPDIEDFVTCKAVEERKAWALIEAGYDGGFNVHGGAYDSVAFQNANHSVRVTDDFMQAVEKDGDWLTRAVTSGESMDRYRATYLMDQIAESTWLCGDPGMQFDTVINDWHTCPETAAIRASNPCSEYMFLDESACNLASLNLMKFYDSESGEFDAASFRHACEVVITAQEIIVGNASYPTAEIGRNSEDYRPLGIGYANLGALLMARGLPYDSNEGRDMAAAVTALLTGASYAQSGEMARAKGAFAGFERNREAAIRVMKKHRNALLKIERKSVPTRLWEEACESWDQVVERAEIHGLRNSQISVLAPTGTIAFMMDCDTTGVEPDIALVKYKKLVGGGMMKIVNRTVPIALRRLGYDDEKVEAIVDHIDATDTIEGAEELEAEHLPIFDCAFKAQAGSRSIHHMGHLRMLAAVQPFISGAISKTINMPEESTPAEIREAYMEGWRLGLKAIAIYRDGCKRSQPLSTRKDEAEEVDLEIEKRAHRRKLPDEREAITHKFSVGGHEGYITVGLYEDGQPGEIFLVMAKEGSTISGLMDAFATAISISLQYGVPLQTMVDKFSHTRFEPSGFTNNAEIRIAKSVTDYIFRWLASKFLGREEKRAAGLILPDEDDVDTTKRGPAVESLELLGTTSGASTFLFQQDAPSCQECGSIMVRNGTCYRCQNCGSTTGCG